MNQPKVSIFLHNKKQKQVRLHKLKLKGISITTITVLNLKNKLMFLKNLDK